MTRRRMRHPLLYRIHCLLVGHCFHSKSANGDGHCCWCGLIPEDD